MCIGIPMQVIESGPYRAWCEDSDGQRQVDMMLVGEQPRGTWLLVFQGTARELMGESQALKVRDALKALGEAAEGRPVDYLFADLIDREPELPEFLKDSGGEMK